MYQKVIAKFQNRHLAEKEAQSVVTEFIIIIR